ncbi:hypothetical protein COO91_06188 [Nostoc flagelliforme CCNUN1]|uniref:Uncharacterized protein n=1 Tax=Nostoc flagelliforme CCNUN1 TaxID=2038116 RepID=A0A2K8SXM5_9NOSO|nr:hypothetical protein COO91_06188 [Nostoc flagelliforme CCNUN1]
MAISTNKKSNRIPPIGKILGSIQFSGINGQGLGLTVESITGIVRVMGEII